jgi:hypothetical protein
MAEVRFTLSKVEEIRKELKLVPAVGPEGRPMTKQSAVRALHGEITNLGKRGYSLEQIAEMLSVRGLQLSPATLRGYLRKPRKAKTTCGHEYTGRQ